ncbi:MAG: YbaN family protein [Pseudomonadota bacterium]
MRAPYLYVMRVMWTVFGWCAVALGAIGAFLPLLPTVPFLLLGAFCFARGSDRFHEWLVTHPRFGPPIQDWRSHGAIRPRAKVMAMIAIAASVALPLMIGVPDWVLMVQIPVLACVVVFILSRPSGPQGLPQATETPAKEH